MQTELEEMFFTVLEKNKNSIYRICKCYASNPMEPEDLIQEVIYNIWKSLPSFQHQSNISTWVYRITLNVCLRAKMKLERSPERFVRLSSIYIDRAEDENSNDDLYEKKQLLYFCISKLSDTDKSIILLFLENQSYKEIATITGLTENHIAVKMGRIRKKLSACITIKFN